MFSLSRKRILTGDELASIVCQIRYFIEKYGYSDEMLAYKLSKILPQYGIETEYVSLPLRELCKKHKNIISYQEWAESVGEEQEKPVS